MKSGEYSKKIRFIIMRDMAIWKRVSKEIFLHLRKMEHIFF